jgi:hypothetical protein
MYGLKPVPFKLKPLAFRLKPLPFKLKPVPVKPTGYAFRLPVEQFEPAVTI